MRDIALFLVVAGVVLLGLRSTFVAYLAWGWTSVLSPVFLMFGFMASARLNLLFAVLASLMLLLRRHELRSFEPNRSTLLLLLFFGHASLSALLALPGNPFNTQYYEIFLKSLVFALLLPMVVYNRLRLHALVLVVTLAMSLGAIVDGLKTLLTLGSHQVYGPGLNMLSDNNHFAAGVLLVLPLSVYAAQYAKNRWARIGLWGVAAIFAFCILGSRSRGAFVGLLAMAACMFIVSRRKGSLLLVGSAIAFVFLNYFSDSIFDRLATLETAQVDGSFKQRLNAWRVASAIALDNPIFGGGFHAQQSQLNWLQYMNAPALLAKLDIAGEETTARAAHSIYFEVLGDLGFVGLILFLGLLANALISLLAVARNTRGVVGLRWAQDLAFTLLLCLVGYMVAGAAVSLAYMELFYIVLMAVEALRQTVKRELVNLQAGSE